ncbi:hypothetical protein [Specibacter sp. RAF43]|uniref:hypothetical protein n=1 Tax=Specibacter sp. RAF43 TaxID=3233057 RepID=UPI003F9D1B0A
MTSFNNSPGNRKRSPVPRTTVDYEDPAWDYGNPFGEDAAPREQIRRNDHVGNGAASSPDAREPLGSR